MKSIIACCIVVTIPLFAFGTEIVVDPGGGGDATTIQGGLDLAVSGDIVRVAPGTYYEDIVMQSGVKLASQSGPEVTIIDPGGVEGILCERCEAGTKITGFTLTNGGGYSGGAVRLFDSSHVEVSHCIIENNHSSFESSGVHVQQYCYAYIHDNVFRNNTSYHSVCIAVIVYSDADVVDNQFIHNTSEFLSAGVGVNRSTCYLEGNVFYENVSVNGSAVRSWRGTIELKNNTFIRNSSVAEAADVTALSSSTLILERNLFAFSAAGPAVLTSSYPVASCNTFWEYETYVSAPVPVIGENGNVIQDPMICVNDQKEGALSEYSPCLTGPCAVVGANPDPACVDAVPTQPMSWSDVKSLYR